MPDKDTSKTPSKPQVLRESEFFGGCIRVKISVKNTSGLVIADAALELESDENVLHFDRCEPEYSEKKGKLILGSIYPNTDKTIAFYLDPLICAKEGTDINCRIFFKDAFGRSDMVQMEPLKIKVVCPIFRTEQDVNIGRLKELVSALQFHDSKIYTLPKRVEISELLGTCRNVIQLHDVRHIKTFKTTDEKTYEAWYYGKTKVTKKDLVIKCAICKDTESIEVLASGNDPADITGLLAEIGRNLTKEFERLGKVQPVFNIHIKDSIIQRSNLLSFCNMDGTCGGDVVIEDSVVQRANIGVGNEAEEKERKEKLRIEQEEEERQRREEAQRREKEERERTVEEREEKEAHIEPERKLWKGFLAAALVLGLLLIGYLVLTPTVVIQEIAPPTVSIAATNNPDTTITDLIILHKGGDNLYSGNWKLSIVPAGNPPEYITSNYDFLVGDTKEAVTTTEGAAGLNYSGVSGGNPLLSGSNYDIKLVDVASKVFLLSVIVNVSGESVSQASSQQTPDVIQTPIQTVSSISVIEPVMNQKTITNSIGMEFVQIPAGEFDMGSPSNEAGRYDNEGQVHRVKIANTFYMGKYEVTQKQWRDVMGSNSSNFQDDNLPVESVSWNDAQEFIKKLNEKEGANKYRLPSEAEWEYAARAGTTTRYSFGDDESKLGEYAWYDGNSGSKTHEVGQKKPNPWGLYDMHGNVWEWVQDIYQTNYNGAPTDGRAWENSGWGRVARGGSWLLNARVCRSAYRFWYAPVSRLHDVGFRLLRIF